MTHRFSLALFAALTACAHPANGFGGMGHRAVALVAEALLSPTAFRRVTSILDAGSRQMNETLADASVWPDEIRDDPAQWGWSYDLHYVDTDTAKCDYVKERDCPKGICVVGAITNFTSQVTDAAGSAAHASALSASGLPERDALAFLTHFVGDVHMPLHASGELLGGNGMKVSYFGEETNLHKLWDSGLLGTWSERHGSTEAFAFELLRKVSAGGEWHDQVPFWTKCRRERSSPSAAYEPCPGDWADESAGFACTYAWRDVEQGSKLGEEYYTSRMPFLEFRIAQAGVRLADVLNSILG